MLGDALTKHALPWYGLLLLPRPPMPPTMQAVAAAYEKPLSCALQSIVKSDRDAALDVALPITTPSTASHGSLNFASMATLVSAVYALLSHLCRAGSKSEHTSGQVDARVLLLYYDARKPETTASSYQYGPLGMATDLYTLVHYPREWNRLFIVEGEIGEEIYQRCRAIAFERHGFDAVQELMTRPERVPGGLVMHRPTATLQICPGLPPIFDSIILIHRFLNMGFEAKTLLSLAAYLASYQSSRLARGMQQRVLEVTFAVPTPGSPVVLNHQEDLSTPEDLERQATEFLCAVTDYGRQSSVNRSIPPSNGTAKSGDLDVKVNSLDAVLELTANDQHLPVAALVFESDYHGLSRHLAEFEHRGWTVIRIPDLEPDDIQSQELERSR